MLVEIKGKRGEEQLVTDSRKVAEKFGKLHKDVLESIRNILVAENSAVNFFKEYSYSSRGKQYPCYLMNRDGFSLLVMGFTGNEAIKWKLEYIDAFNAMEKELKRIYDERQRAELERAKGIITRHILTDTIKLKIADSAHKKFIYPNYTKLIYKVLFGKTMPEMREYYKVEGKESVREHMTPEELLAVNNMEGLISGLINYGWSYEKIKEFVTKQSMQAIAQ
nr:MAG TPA: regulatory protein [Caudoviricetes sp.]